MNTALLLLIQLGVLSVLVATFLIPSLVAQYSFGLRSPWPMLIGASSLAGMILVLFFYMMRKQREDRKVLSVSHHAVFGDVRQLRDHWEATLPFNPDAPDIEVWGEAHLPSQIEIENFTAIRKRYSDLLGDVHAAVRSSFPEVELSIEALRLGNIMFWGDAFGSFDLTFSSPLLERHFPWGLTVSFVDFKIDDISDNH